MSDRTLWLRHLATQAKRGLKWITNTGTLPAGDNPNPVNLENVVLTIGGGTVAASNQRAGYRTPSLEFLTGPGVESGP